MNSSSHAARRFPAALRLLASVFCLLSIHGRGEATSSLAPAPDPAFIDQAGLVKAEPFDLAQVRLLDGIFKQNQQVDEKFILSLDPDRLLHNFFVNARLPSTATPYGGWEAPSHGLRGHFTGHYLSALAQMYAATGDQTFKDRGTKMVAALAQCQEALGNGYLSAFPSTIFDKMETKGQGGTCAPYYTIHKIMAGLLDQYHYCGNQQALTIVCKMADYFKSRMDKLTPEQIEYTLYTSNKGPLPRHEFGGMPEVLNNLYAVTHQPRYLALANLFDRSWFLDPLIADEDQLAGLHANTHIPQVVGFARRYELTGDERFRQAADHFWSAVTQHHSYALGDDSRGEVFLPPGVEANGLRADTAETCNVYNMLKLTEHLFTWLPDTATADYFELALYNHILSSIDPVSGAMTYYLSLKPGHFKLYGTPDAAFWCCTGTGMENHAKYGSAIYYHHADALWVNLFIPSQLNWPEKGISLTQNTTFPKSDLTTLTFTTSQPVKLNLLLRSPGWATPGVSISVNGAPVNGTARPGSYVSVDRVWKNGDQVTFHLPMSLHLHYASDNPKSVAIMYGPVVLAGRLGTDGLPPVQESGYHREFMKDPDPKVPSLSGDSTSLASWIKPAPGQPLHFTVATAGQPADLNLEPLYEIQHERYSVYWSYSDTAPPRQAARAF